MSDDDKRVPSYEDVITAFARIRQAGGVLWDHEHPLRRFELAAQCGDVARGCERLAAHRLAERVPPLGYYDTEIASLHEAIKLLLAERAADHGSAAWSLVDAADTAEMLGLDPVQRRGA